MHNAIHTLVGQNGHMAFVPYAGFDPIFWLHHTNVDRLFAIWQAIYPDAYTTPQADSEGTFTIAPGNMDDINTRESFHPSLYGSFRSHQNMWHFPYTTPICAEKDVALTPFHAADNSTLYTSATARSTRSFGYTYPEVTDWNVTADQLSSNTRANLNKLYNPAGSIATRSLKRHQINPHRSQYFPGLRYPNGSDPAYHYVESGTREYQYFVNIRVDKYVFPPSAFVPFPLPTPSCSTQDPNRPIAVADPHLPLEQLSSALSSSTSSSVPSPSILAHGHSPQH